MKHHALSSNDVAAAVRWACVTELEAPKPGNVGYHSDGHGMSAQDFVLSAECVAPVLAEMGLTLGERILKSIETTRAMVGCNTNLGIVLLCAPLAQAALGSVEEPDLRRRVTGLLGRLTQNDTVQVFAAIRIARPGGLGHSSRHDVEQPANAPLLEVMAEAQQRDRIAYQYVHQFEDVFQVGLPALSAGLSRWQSETSAALVVYLEFLARFPDTHIERKLGVKTAEEVRLAAKKLLSFCNASDSPTQAAEPLLAFDQSLKQRGINPGTSADLTVATLFAKRLQTLIDRQFADQSRVAVGTGSR